MLRLVVINSIFDLFLNLFGSLGLFYFYSKIQDSLNAGDITSFLLFVSLVQFLLNFLNFGSEFKFLIDSDYENTIKSGSLVTFKRFIYYIFSSALISIISLLLYKFDIFHLKINSFSFILIFLYSIFGFYLVYFNLFLIRRFKNRCILAANFFAILFICISFYILKIDSIEILLFIFSISQFIRFLIISFFVNIEARYLKVHLVGSDSLNLDSIFNAKWFLNYLGNPLGLLYAYLVSVYISESFNSNISVALLICLKVINQVLSISTGVISPIFYRHYKYLVKILKFNYFLLINFLIALTFLVFYILVINSPLLINIASFLFKTVSKYDAVYYLTFLSPVVCFGFFSSLFAHSFSAVNGALVRNILLFLGIIYIAIGIFIFKFFNFRTYQLEYFIVWEVFFDFIFFYLLTKKIYKN